MNTLALLLASVRREAFAVQHECRADGENVTLRTCTAFVVRGMRHKRGQPLPPRPRITRRERERRATEAEQTAAQSLVDAAIAMRGMLGVASDAVLADVYTRLVRLAQHTPFADSHEPLARFAEAVSTEQRQRSLTREDVS
jgi:hypothetical protein